MARALITAADCQETPIPQGLIAWWLGSYTSVPAGWEIADGNISANDPSYTRPNLLNRFLKGVAAAGDSPGTTGGGVAHGHTVASHSHTTSYASPDLQREDISGEGGCGGGHSHTTQAATATLDNATPEPNYTAAIPVVYTLKGGGTRGLLCNRDFGASALPPWKIVAAWNGAAASVPPGWSKCDGSTVNGVATPNLLGKYLRGVPTSETGPGTAGGALTHTHNVDHTHGTGGATATGGSFGGSSWCISSGHTHTLQSAGGTSNAQNHEPSYITTHFVCFTGHGSGAAAHFSGQLTGGDLSANLLAPRGLVMAWTFSLASRPSDWAMCDGGAWNNGTPTGYAANRPNALGRFLKHIPNGTTDGGGTGGSDSHTHTGGSHSHTVNQYCGGIAGEYSSGDTAAYCHTHNSSGTTYYSLAADNKPPYYEVAFLVRD